MKYLIHFLLILVIFSCKDPVEILKSSEKKILAFSIEEVSPKAVGVIDTINHVINVSVSSGVNVQSLTPKITLSEKTQISPAIGTKLDFTNPVKYTLTAEDGTTIIYTVIVKVVKSSQKEILSLSFANSTLQVKIDSGKTNYLIEVPLGTPIENLKPIFKLSEKATITTFYNNEYQDFSSEVGYRVTAEDGTTKNYYFKMYFAINPKIPVSPNPEKALVIVSGGTFIEAYEAKTGKKVWNYNNKGGFIFSNPSFYKGNIYFTSGSGFAVVESRSGNEVFRAQTSQTSHSTPVFYEDKLYFGSGEDGMVRAIDISKGEKIWTTDAEYWTNSSPTIANGKLFMSIENGNQLNAFDLKTGERIWNTSDDFSLGIFSGETNTCTFQNLVISFQPSALVALDQNTGKRLWRFEEPDVSNDSSPTIADDVIYFGGGNGKIYAISAANGKKIWETKTGSGIDSSPQIVDLYGYIASKDGYLYAFTKDKGTILWKFKIGEASRYSFDYIDSSPVVANGVVYIYGRDGNFYAIDSLYGTKIWSISNVGYQSLISALVINPDGSSFQSGISGGVN